MHEAHRGGRAGQRLQQRHHAVRGNEVHHHQIHRESLQVRAVPDRSYTGAFGSVGGVHPAAPAAHLVLVVLGHPHGHLRDLMGLVAVDHPQIPGRGQVVPAVTAAVGEPVLVLIGVLGPPQVRPRRPALLALGPRRPDPAAFLLHRRGLARITVARGRTRRVPRVTREQMLHPGQLGGLGLVGLHQLRDLPGHRADLPGLAAHEHDQLLARHLLRHRHPKIQALPSIPPQPTRRAPQTAAVTPTPAECLRSWPTSEHDQRRENQSGNFRFS